MYGKTGFRNEGAKEAGEYAEAAGGRGVLPAVRGEEGAGPGQVRGRVPGPGQGQQEDIRSQAHQNKEERAEGESGGRNSNSQEVFQSAHN